MRFVGIQGCPRHGVLAPCHGGEGCAVLRMTTKMTMTEIYATSPKHATFKVQYTKTAPNNPFAFLLNRHAHV